MFRTIILLSIAGAASVRGDAGFDCDKYQTECVDTEITDAYENCDATHAANVDGMSCRIEHLGYIIAGDDATRDLHCSHAAEVADGPCAEENPLAPFRFDCDKYQTECVDTEITDAYENCDATHAANVDGMSCRIEHLGYIIAGDDATRDLHCSHAAEVADGPCAEENPLAPFRFDCDKYQTECVDSGVTAAYVDGCEIVTDANTGTAGNTEMKCRIEHLGYIIAGDDATRDLHCSHAAEVADGPCETEKLKTACEATTGCTEADADGDAATSGSWCSWAECADSYDTRATHDGVDFCHASKDNCEGACATAAGEGAGAAKYCSESTTSAGGCPSMCVSEEAVECDKECTPCLSGLSTTSGKDCSTCGSCIVYAPCVSCDEDAYVDALFQSSFTAALKELGLSVTDITAFAETVEALPENSPLEKMLGAAVEKAFGETDTPPTLEAATAAMNTFFASAEFRAELQSAKLFSGEGIDADLLAAVSTASETASENANENADGAGETDSENANENADGAGETDSENANENADGSGETDSENANNIDNLSGAAGLALNLAVVAMAAAALF